MALTALEAHEKTYNNIIKFYDIAEYLINTVENPAVSDPAKQLDIVEPLIEQIEVSADVLAEEYRNFVKGKTQPNLEIKHRMEAALVSIYSALKDCKEKVQSKA